MDITFENRIWEQSENKISYLETAQKWHTIRDFVEIFKKKSQSLEREGESREQRARRKKREIRRRRRSEQSRRGITRSATICQWWLNWCHTLLLPSIAIAVRRRKSSENMIYLAYWSDKMFLRLAMDGNHIKYSIGALLMKSTTIYTIFFIFRMFGSNIREQEQKRFKIIRLCLLLMFILQCLMPYELHRCAQL